MGGFEVLYQRMHGTEDGSVRRLTQATGKPEQTTKRNLFTFSILFIQSLVSKFY